MTSAAIASSVLSAVRLSATGSKNSSNPVQRLVSTGTPHAAASKSRPDGQWPIAAVAPRVTFSVSREDAKNDGWSSGGRWLTKKILSVQGKSAG